MANQFSHRTVIVTGASAGVGEAVAKRFAREGANVVLAARSGDVLQQLADSLGGGERLLVQPTDVADLKQCEALIAATVERFGGIDVLVNNAGFNSRGELETVPVEDISKIIDVNLKAPIVLSRLAIPHLKQSPHGAIVNVASLAGRVPLPDEATYSATKFGLRAMTFAVAEELRDTRVTVSAVSPGPIDTGFIMSDIEEVPELVFSQPMSSADEVADCVIACVRDGKRERAIPASSGVLATAAYLIPGMRRVLEPVLEAKGRKAKQAYLARNASR